MRGARLQISRILLETYLVYPVTIFSLLGAVEKQTSNSWNILEGNRTNRMDQLNGTVEWDNNIQEGIRTNRMDQ